MFSIVIPLYNKQDSIADTIESVLNQSFADYEIIIVNDGSTDQSLERVLEFSDPRIQIISKENGGVSSARNRGIEEAKNKYIAFIDADDTWDPDYLLEQKKLIEDFPYASMWGLGYSKIISGKTVEVIPMNMPFEYRGIVRNFFSRKSRANLFCSSAVVISKQVFEDIEPFDHRMDIGEDLDMWFRIILNKEVVFYNRVLAYYKHDAENRAMAKKKPDLTKTILFHVEKFDAYKTHTPDAISYIHAFCAGYLLPYYFGTRKERRLAQSITPRFDYSKIHRKYALFYKTPYFIGLIFYFLYVLKKLS